MNRGTHERARLYIGRRSRVSFHSASLMPAMRREASGNPSSAASSLRGNCRDGDWHLLDHPQQEKDQESHEKHRRSDGRVC